MIKLAKTRFDLSHDARTFSRSRCYFRRSMHCLPPRFPLKRGCSRHQGVADCYVYFLACMRQQSTNIHSSERCIKRVIHLSSCCALYQRLPVELLSQEVVSWSSSDFSATTRDRVGVCIRGVLPLFASCQVPPNADEAKATSTGYVLSLTWSSRTRISSTPKTDPEAEAKLVCVCI